MNIKEYIESGIIESYVLGLTESEDTLEVEQLSRQYSEVQQAIEEFSLAVETSALQNAVAPPSHIKEKLMAEILANNKNTSGESPLVVAYNSKEEIGTIREEENTSSRWRFLAAASIILFVASCAGNIYLYSKYTRSTEQYVALLNERNTLQANNQVYQTQLKEYRTAAQFMADPNVAMVKMSDPANIKDAVTTVFWDQQTKDVYLMANKLPEPASDKQYQLWALVDGQPVDAGMLDPNCTTLCKMKNIARAQAFAITLEKTGGSPVPTMEQLYVLGKI